MRVPVASLLGVRLELAGTTTTSGSSVVVGVVQVRAGEQFVSLVSRSFEAAAFSRPVVGLPFFAAGDATTAIASPFASTTCPGRVNAVPKVEPPVHVHVHLLLPSCNNGRLRARVGLVAFDFTFSSWVMGVGPT